MAGLSWVYSNHPESDLLLIAAGDKDKNPEIMKSRLEVIYQMFMEKYQITPYELEETLIDQGRFADFGQIVDELHEQWKLAERIITGGTARMFDMMGIFQQVFNRMTEILTNYYLIVDPEKIPEMHQEIRELLRDFQSMPEFEDYPELKKIEYSEMGWNVVNLNPNNLEEDILQRIMVMITVQLHNIIKGKLPEANRFLAYSKNIYSYLIRQYDLLHSLNINSLILRIFLT